ncbi:MAG: heme NO-binding domain-containing protein [Vannielia sp.]|uniref:heme NO-binding domain-containing protein n=1 Tax=Rhodobacterales TaxID=204455 RepID=UPI0020963820|nr:heme NO-binding domain-containing protein [Oceanicola sp. 502str15]MCO6381581.1 heme NO-binding protein [Oceanicola sp. 502str15]
MHGLVNRAVQCFVRDIYGPEAWAELGAAMGIGSRGFEAMLTYEDSVTFEMLDQLSHQRQRPVEDILEDLGTYLVAHPNTRAIRRLLRFGGQSFAELLHSLDDLPDRAGLAVPELELPALALIEVRPGRYKLEVTASHGGYGPVLTGILRALADDYGALAFLELQGGMGRHEVILIDLLDAEFAEAKQFYLGRGHGQRVEGAG